MICTLPCRQLWLPEIVENTTCNWAFQVTWRLPGELTPPIEGNVGFRLRIGNEVRLEYQGVWWEELNKRRLWMTTAFAEEVQCSKPTVYYEVELVVAERQVV
jgi:hypothetical protein